MNHPQAFSHGGVISTGINLGRQIGRLAEHPLLLEALPLCALPGRHRLRGGGAE